MFASILIVHFLLFYKSTHIEKGFINTLTNKETNIQIFFRRAKKSLGNWLKWCLLDHYKFLLKIVSIEIKFV